MAPDPHDVELALAECAREPIHVPGAIQDAGVLLATSAEVGAITHVSAGAELLVGAPPSALLGRALDLVLPGALLHAVRGAAGLSVLREQREYLGRFSLATGGVHASAHLSGASFVLELEADGGRAPAHSGELAVRHLLTRHRRAPGLAQLLDAGARGLRELLGYQRVMVYRFMSDGDGEVVAESLAPGLTPYLGLRYPAADIPPQARALYLRAPLRMIADVARPPRALLAADRDAPPLDLSLAQLRAVSPVHLAYLTNMGVAASLSLAIVVEGALWGLVACHHGEPRTPSPAERAAAELYGQMLSLLVGRALDHAQSVGRERAQEALGELIASTEGRSWAEDPRIAELLLAVVPADGVVYTALDGRRVHHGLTPRPEVVQRVQARATAQTEELAASCELRAWLGPGEHALQGCAGVLAVNPAPLQHPMEIQFYRREVLDEIRWGGNPDKLVVETAFGPRLSPRESFAEYRRARSGHARAWTADDLARARGLSHILLRILARDARESRERALLLESHHERQQLLVAELNHRVKNLLALIRSIVRQTAKSADGVEVYAQDLERRLVALALAHDLAARAHMHAVDLRTLVVTELSPYRSPGSEDLVLTGPPLSLKAEVAPTLALVLHELASNAAKYGALSRAGGEVHVSWWLTGDALELRFVERCGPPVLPATRTGFGMTLIARSIAYELDGHSTLSLLPEGASFEATIPLHHLSEPGAAARPASIPPPPVAPSPAALGDVLVLEDNLLLATELEHALSSAGLSVVAVSSVLAAEQALACMSFQAAVLDVNLRGELSYAVASSLADLGTPYVFLTGYGDELSVPSALAGAPRLSKPVATDELVRLVVSMVAR